MPWPCGRMASASARGFEPPVGGGDRRAIGRCSACLDACKLSWPVTVVILPQRAVVMRAVMKPALCCHLACKAACAAARGQRAAVATALDTAASASCFC